jgi:hypothetical protein
MPGAHISGPTNRTKHSHSFSQMNSHCARAGLVCRALSRNGGTRGKLHLECRALAQSRLDPDATTVHLHDLLGDGEAQTGAPLALVRELST